VIDNNFIEILTPKEKESLKKFAVEDVTALYVARNTPYGIAIQIND